MRTTVQSLLSLALIGACTSSTTVEKPTPASSFDPSAEAPRVEELLRRYEAALNAADVPTIVALYADDGVFMAQHRSPAIGQKQVEAAYSKILSMIRLDIAFEIDEVVVVSPGVAYARTRSAGTTTIIANDAKISEGNQELFVLVRNGDDGWRIGRYIFSTTQPREG